MSATGIKFLTESAASTWTHRRALVIPLTLVVLYVTLSVPGNFVFEIVLLIESIESDK